MFVILKKKEYDQMREDLACARQDAASLEMKVTKLEGDLKSKDSAINALQLARGITENNLKEEMKRRDLEWYAKWSDEVIKNAAAAKIIQQQNTMFNQEEPEDDIDDGYEDEEGEVL